MRSRTNDRLIRLCASLALLAGMGQATVAAESGPAKLRIFDGTTKRIAYQSSSNAGQDQLQVLLRLVPGGEALSVDYQVMSYSLIMSPRHLKKLAGYPVVVRRVNNNFNPTFRIEGPEDHQGIAEAVAKLTAMSQHDREQGLGLVFYHSGHYHERTTPEEVRYIYNIRLAYQALAERGSQDGHFFIDVLTPTKAHHPATVKSDAYHASPVANWLEGREIVRAMCRHDGIPMPATIDTRVEAELASAAEIAGALRILSPQGLPEQAPVYRPGDLLTLTWQADPATIPQVAVFLHRLTAKDYLLAEPVVVGQDGQGSFSWTVTGSLVDVNYHKPGGVRFLAAEGAPEPIDTKERPNHPDPPFLYCFRVVAADAKACKVYYDFSAPFYLDLKPAPADPRPPAAGQRPSPHQGHQP